MANTPFAEKDSEGRYLCQVCGKPFKRITPFHLKTHKITLAEYNYKYFDIEPLEEKENPKVDEEITNDFAGNPEAKVVSFPYLLFDEDKKVICQICGKSFNSITDKHLQSHKIKMVDYQKRYPGVPTKRSNYTKSKHGAPPRPVKLNQPETLEEFIIQKSAKYKIDPLDKLANEAKETKKDPIASMKKRILETLRKFHANVEMDYLISQFGTDNRLKFEFITDYCDPILKVVFQFPDTFWHNHDLIIDLNKTIKLEKYGWKVIKIKSKNPTHDEIVEALNF